MTQPTDTPLRTESPTDKVRRGSGENRLWLPESLRARAAAQPARRRVLPRAARSVAAAIHHVNDAASAEAMLDFARQRPLSHIGIDAEFTFDTAGVPMKRFGGKAISWHDPRAVRPLLLAVVLVEPQGTDTTHYRYAIDLRRPEVLPSVEEIFLLPYTCVAHFAQAELHCLWQLGLPAPNAIWDTWAAEKAFTLGRFHSKYYTTGGSAAEPTGAAADPVTDRREESETACSLLACCRRYSVSHPFEHQKELLQQSFLDHADGDDFTPEQIEYCVADAAATADLYLPQVTRAAQENALRHLIDIEMPWTVTNARMTWDGVKIDAVRAVQLREACHRHQTQLSGELSELGIANVNSYPQMKRFFDRAGLLENFKHGGEYSFDDKALEAAELLHPVIPKIRALRKVQRLGSDKLLTGELIGMDKRMHPEHRQLGAASSRNSMRWPNIGGIGRALRPLVVPEDSMALGEVDLAQIEVGIAAAIYGDERLVEMFNSGDVYSRMAKLYYADVLSEQQRCLPDAKFKKLCKAERSKMKVFTLAIIYNITPHGLSAQLGISVKQAEAEQQRFLGMFPALAKALLEASEYGTISGFASLVTGLRRHRALQGQASGWERNWMRNTPVQGSAAVVFKAAGNRLYRRYQYYGARLVMPLHDAFIFEAPTLNLETVAKITADVLRGTVQEYFPSLNPQAEINIDHPQCWNKDGKYRSLENWLLSAETAEEYMRS